jgi:hypothetical protein
MSKPAVVVVVVGQASLSMNAKYLILFSKGWIT